MWSRELRPLEWGLRRPLFPVKQGTTRRKGSERLPHLWCWTRFFLREWQRSFPKSAPDAVSLGPDILQLHTVPPTSHLLNSDYFTVIWGLYLWGLSQWNSHIIKNTVRKLIEKHARRPSPWLRTPSRLQFLIKDNQSKFRCVCKINLISLNFAWWFT